MIGGSDSAEALKMLRANIITQLGCIERLAIPANPKIDALTEIAETTGKVIERLLPEPDEPVDRSYA